ncbi:MAG: UbiD family decarboxylase [Magnetococcales bacterium]|nr:UbiD family decarboxylase [Magnetococcales bacterium]NGZ25276.1 UbiD family decarboxylase [Magnetococcales bacterium]
MTVTEHSLPKAFPDLRSFLTFLERKGELLRINAPVDGHLEITAIASRILAEGGPALLFTQVRDSAMPVVANLFGTVDRVGMGMGRSVEQLEELGTLLSQLRQPEPPQSMKEVWPLVKRLSQVRFMRPRMIKNPPCQQVVWAGAELDLARLPVPTCWPGDAGPLVTWGMVVTQGPRGGPVNLGIYRMQVIRRDCLIMRWLPHRGGAQHAREWLAQGKSTMPVAVVIGCDPATLLAAVTPVPETLSEYAFAGLLRQKRVDIAQAMTVPLPVPASAEIVLEGEVRLRELVEEGPFGDHTGYYNEVEKFPLFQVKRITTRKDPYFLTTYTGRPPDEPAILALALNRVFVPLLKKQFPEIKSFHLPAEACSYRMAVVGLEKQYPGHAFRVMAGVWGFLRQFLYTKFIIVVDASVPVDDWDGVMTSVCCNVHPVRDIQVITSTPIDYLDFASPWPGLGSKMGIDATSKWGPEKQAAPLVPDPPASHACDWPLAATKMIYGLREIRLKPGGCLAVARVDKREAKQGQKTVESIWRLVPAGLGADQIIVVDGAIHLDSWNDIIWAIATRVDPDRDLIIDRQHGRFALDATTKLASETSRQWGRELVMDETVRKNIDRRWSELGLTGPVWE